VVISGYIGGTYFRERLPDMPFFFIRSLFNMAILAKDYSLPIFAVDRPFSKAK
jgi:hypothetical protein